jgi:hypothetical protein
MAEVYETNITMLSIISYMHARLLSAALHNPHSWNTHINLHSSYKSELPQTSLLLETALLCQYSGLASCIHVQHGVTYSRLVICARRSSAREAV